MKTRLILAVAAVAVAAPAAAQSVQYRSPAGIEYRSEPDTGAVARAEKAVAADPKNVDKILTLGLAQAGIRQYREAIATFTKGLAIAPKNALMLRWRGHRHLSIREFAKAEADLEAGIKLDPTIYGLWYHLGIVRFIKGDFSGAAAAFAKGQPIAPDAGELKGSTDWLWMSLSRAGRGAEAKAMLDRHPDTLKIENAYAQRLRLYRAEIGPDQVMTPADTAGVQVATLAFGLGNWNLVKGDTAKSKEWFRKSVAARDGWPGFGFIASERELARLH